MKSYLLILITAVALTSAPLTVRAADDTLKRRPDNAEFVTETHVRLTTESLTIAEIAEATSTPTAPQSFWEYLSQATAAFLQAIRDLFN